MIASIQKIRDTKNFDTKNSKLDFKDIVKYERKYDKISLVFANSNDSEKKAWDHHFFGRTLEAGEKMFLELKVFICRRLPVRTPQACEPPVQTTVSAPFCMHY